MNEARLRKGAPPPRGSSPTPIASDPRPDEDRTHLQVVVPRRIFREFSALAAETFDAKKGCKSSLFLAMWESYKAKRTG